MHPLRRGAKRLGQDFEKILKRFELHPEADLEGRDALAFYRERASAEIVLDFDAKITSALAEIVNFPARYPRWQGTHVRKYVLLRFPYLIFYVDYPNLVRILAIAHTSRRPGYWKKRIAVD
jgi:toxin ParE1/3/4